MRRRQPPTRDAIRERCVTVIVSHETNLHKEIEQ